ncbi:MAG TPA: hypothetical protein VFO25_08005 [Candidatus Eremiobacteraceae bacterium]|nr:hypothetical protein [Candidatus Eremiobacteraceae bacterium]
MSRTAIDDLLRESYRESLGRDFSAIVRYLADTIGFKLTAYIARRRQTDRVQAWIDGKESCAPSSPAADTRPHAASPASVHVGDPRPTPRLIAIDCSAYR